ncbi:SH3 domain-containing protein [Aquimarina aquimarini]|uniref:SH3 domain-containing protein n=1 Tax=Aquimarina aquimarini TaxID=1191734 RepID=UPI000D555614|nr:SH3 domain-containing protein [Aquimarina aquimarini]
MKNLLLTIFIIINSNAIYSQEFKAGLIIPNKKFKLCCIYIPNSGLKIYDRPNGKTQGKIYLGKADNNNEFYTALIEKNGIKKNLEYPNLEMVGYEIMALVFINSKFGFVKLNNGYWISSKELKSKNLRLVSWMNYAIEKNTEWYANKPGLNLRKGPSTNFKKITTLKGDLFGITLTAEKKGKWSKVKVTEYRKHPCSGEDNLIIKTYSGWVKLISEEETLNVWNYGKGC